MKNILVLLLTLKSLPIFSQTKSTVFSNYYQALTILNKSIEKHGGIENIKRDIQFSVNGVLYDLGHSYKPEDRNEWLLSEKYVFINSKDILYQFGKIKNKERVYKKASVFNQDSVFYFDYFDGNIKKGNQLTSNSMKDFLWNNLPTTILLEAFNQKTTLSYIGKEIINQNTYDVINFHSLSGIRYSIYINANTLEFFKISQLIYNDIYGDTFIESEFYNYKSINQLLLPALRTDKEFGEIEKKITLSDYEFSNKIDSSIYFICPNCKPIKQEEKFNNILVDTIGKNLYLLKLTDFNNKIMIANFSNYISVFEAPQGITLTNNIIRVIKKMFPNKLIKYCFVSHHHPDHAGGIRQYAKIGSAIVTTETNKDYFKKIINTSHTLNNEFDRASQIKINLSFIGNQKNQKFNDTLNEVVAYNIGNSTEHTQEYLVYYFPKEKIIFVGDLLYLPINEEKHQTGIREKALLNLITSKELQVDKIYTSWPLKNQKEYGTISDLK